MLIGLVPIHNEEKSIIEVLNKLEKQVGYIVVVNDGSTDRAHSFISEWLKNKKNADYLSFQKNRGMSYALRQGFIYISEQIRNKKFSHDDAIVTIDGDGQHDPEKINTIHDYFIKNNLDVLICNRDLSNYPRYRVLGNRLTSLVASLLGKTKFKDIECGFKILKASFVKDMLDYYIGIRYSCACEIGLIASLLGYKIDNSYPIRASYYRRGGPGFIDLFINIISCLTIILRIRFSKK